MLYHFLFGIVLDVGFDLEKQIPSIFFSPLINNKNKNKIVIRAFIIVSSVENLHVTSGYSW
jgi:hypothetical protein